MNTIILYPLLYLFILHFGKCTTNIKEVKLKQQTFGKGFHKIFATNITVSGNVTGCRIVLEQLLPNNVYVILDELRELKNKNELFTKLNRKIDTEADQSNALPISVLLYANHKLALQSNDYLSIFQFKLPIHLRYHTPKAGGGYVTFSLHSPKLFMRCSTPLPDFKDGNKLPCTTMSPDICDWSSIPFTEESSKITLQVPVGDSDLNAIVSTVTIFVTFFAAIYSAFRIHTWK